MNLVQPKLGRKILIAGVAAVMLVRAADGVAQTCSHRGLPPPSTMEKWWSSVFGGGRPQIVEIDPRELPISNVQFDMSDRVLNGRIRNGSKHLLVSFDVAVSVFDCAPGCEQIWEERMCINAVVPPGQSRDFQGASVRGVIDNAPRIRGQGRFSVRVTGAGG